MFSGKNFIKKHKLFLISGVISTVSFLCIFVEISASSRQNINSNITIGIDRSFISLLNKYKAPASIVFESEDSTDRKAFWDMPKYPLSRMVISSVKQETGTFVYETGADPGMVSRFFIREMKRRKWDMYPRAFPGGIIMFHNGKSTCFFSTERDFGTTIVIVCCSNLVNGE